MQPHSIPHRKVSAASQWGKKAGNKVKVELVVKTSALSNRVLGFTKQTSPFFLSFSSCFLAFISLKSTVKRRFLPCFYRILLRQTANFERFPPLTVKFIFLSFRFHPFAVISKENSLFYLLKA